ncbi:MAG: hypothetical protein VX681_03655 [Myxococcota bacterium]|nr:hypothetical protein [Myxococcota bacterium]
MSEAQHNRGLWLGPLIAVLGVASYFTLIVRWPTLSDFPWLNLAILGGAVAASARALPRAWSRGGAARRAAAVAGLSLSSLCTVILVYYCFFESYGVPDAASALPTGEPVPALTLSSHLDEPVDLAQLARGDVVLVFYRGHW